MIWHAKAIKHRSFSVQNDAQQPQKVVAHFFIPFWSTLYILLQFFWGDSALTIKKDRIIIKT